MRKITTFFLLFLAGVWSSTMTAQTTSKTLIASDAPTENGWAANTTWYWIRNGNQGAGSFLCTDNAYMSNGNFYLNVTTPPSTYAAQWCLVPVEGQSNRYKLYNRNEGPTKVFGSTGSGDNARCKMYDSSEVTSDVTTEFDIVDSKKSTNSIYRKCIKYPGSDNNCLCRNGNSTKDGFKYVTYWNSTNALNDDGSSWIFEQAPTQFDITSSMDAPHWYYLTINTTVNNPQYDRKRLTYDGTTFSKKSNGSYNSSTTTETLSFISPLNNLTQDLWCIKGNPWSGYEFYHYSGKVLTMDANATSGNAELRDESECDDITYIKHWILTASTQYQLATDETYVFGLKTPASPSNKNYCLNVGGTPLNLWDRFDKGSTFRVFEPEFDVALNTATIDDASCSVATLALPYDFKAAASNTNTQIYWMNGQTNGYANLEAAESVAAGAGVILQNSAAATSVRMVATGGAPAFTGNLLTGTTTEVSDLSGKLVFGRSATTGKVGFFTPSGTSPIPANRAYIETSKLSGASVQALYLSFDGTETGIEQIIPASEETPVIANAPVYDLSGRRVGQAVRGGVYIQNGKKFILK